MRVVEQRPDGVVIRGAKLHNTGGTNSHEIFVMPRVGMPPEEADYAVACAVPTDAPGLSLVFGRRASTSGRRRPAHRRGTHFGVVGGEAR